MTKLKINGPEKLQNGQVRWWAKIDLPGGEVQPDGSTKRKQLKITKPTKTEVLDEIARVRYQANVGTYVATSKTTLSEWVDIWFKQATEDVTQATVNNINTAMRPVREYLGHVPLQLLTEEHIDALRDWMLTEGRKRGGKPGTGLSLRSVQNTLAWLRPCLNKAVRRNLVVRNVALDTKVKGMSKERRRKRAANSVWNEAEVKAFISGIREERLFAPLLLSLCGLRPAEVCGLRWSDIDLSAGTVSLENTRTDVYVVDAPEGNKIQTIEKDTKTESGERVLPLPEPVKVALKAFRTTQTREKLAAPKGVYTDSGYAIVDELGSPLTTIKLREAAYILMRETGMRKVRLYDARHSCLTWMRNSGVPRTIVARWAGHSNPAFTDERYAGHADVEALRQGADSLGGLLG